MRYTTDTDHPFDTDNRAWRRFTDVAGEHFDIVGWTKDDGRPVLTTLIDLASGDAFTIAILDSVEVRQPHALLAFTPAGDLSAHGPFDGEPAAASHAPGLAMTDPTVAATRPVPLHQPDQPTLPDDAWFAVPDPLARVARPALADTRTTVLVLVDRTRAVLAAVGPFRTRAAAEAWRPTPDLGPDTHPDVDRLIVPLRPAPIGPDLP
jgi:hypothetical protein